MAYPPVIARLLFRVALLFVLCPTAASARTLRVGPGRALAAPSAAAAVAHDGDTILIDAADYRGDVATWTQSNLTLRGVGGRARLTADGASAQGKAIWVIAGDRVRVEHVAFRGARVADRNGAGIRQEGAGVTIVDCVFEDNENGILAGENRRSDIVIERSRFVGNGAGDGQSHNIYIGVVRSFTLRFSVVAAANVGHEVKSRALRTTLRANTIDDRDGTASYSVELPNGGRALLVGNLVIQGPNSENTGIVSYGAEGDLHPDRRLTLAFNTIVNRIPDRGAFVSAAVGTRAVLRNNAIAGDGVVLTGVGNSRGDVRVRADRFRPRPGSRLVGRAVRVAPALVPGFEPAGTMRSRRPVVGRRDVGAFELRPR